MLNYTIQMKFNKTNKNYRIQLKLKNMYEKLQNTNKIRLLDIELMNT